ncbi:MAG: hypothetical protein IJ678_07970, partial [Kiritimatiellae bacterium]|nr:hypothetical protein [Kiritimatiellia bacterium]
TAPAAGKTASIGRLTSNLTSAAAETQTTMRIKRPAPAAAAPAPSPESESEKSSTVHAKPILLKKPESGETPTIRLKPGEPAAAAAKPKITLKGAAPAAEAEPVKSTNDGIEAPPAAFAATDFAKPEKVSAFFPVVAALAMVATIGICLLFMSEWSGPNPSLTRFSSWVDGPAVLCPGCPRVTVR